MLDPVAAGSPFFEREIINGLLEKAKAPKDERAGLQIWHEYNASHRYAIGADTAKGKRQRPFHLHRDRFHSESCARRHLLRQQHDPG